MNGFQAIKRQLLPLLKGLPIIIGVFAVALFLARKVVQYTPNTYQTIARIKLDDQRFGFSNNLLYKDFDVFSTESRVQSEAILLASPMLIEMALDSLDFEMALYRKGQMKNTMLYDDSPILVTYDFLSEELYDQDYFVRVFGDHTYALIDEDGEIELSDRSPLGDPLMLDGGILTVSTNDSLLALRDLDLEDDYIIHVFSRQGLIEDVRERLDVTEMDKEIPILRVVYKDQHPRKVSDLANAICNAYVKDYVANKSEAAQATVDFIDQKIEEVHLDLQRAEVELEQYKAQKGIVNTRQETETGLRQISQLEVSLINLEMNEKAILALEEYISEGDYFNQTAINFGFGDLLMTELVKKLKLWQDERHDLLLRYTEDSDRVKNVEQKIEELKRYIVEAIKRNKVEIETKRADVERSLEEASHQFDGLSTKEKELRVLERNFHLLEQVYNFLSQKKIEASIAASANLSFHRIIEPAPTPKKPVSPNRTLIVFVSGLLGLILGIAFIYLRQYAIAAVSNRLDIERNTSAPVAGVVRHKNDDVDFDAIIQSLRLKGHLTGNNIISVTSTIAGEGKTFVAVHLAKRMADFGMQVCLLDINAEHPQDQLIPCGPMEEHLQDPLECPGSVVVLTHHQRLGLDWQEKVDRLKEVFDVVVIDAPASAIQMEAIQAMKVSDVAFYVLRSNKTSIDYVGNIERVMEEYHLDNVQVILNDAHQATSFNGNYVGTRFRYAAANSGLRTRLAGYVNTYLR